MTSTVSITGLSGPHYRNAKIVIDGIEIPMGLLRGARIDMEAGAIPTLELDFMVSEYEGIDGEMHIVVAPDVHEALVQLGRTPPEGVDS